MNIFFYILVGLLAIAGAWFIFNKIGDKLGSYLTDRYYSLELARPMTFKEMEKVIADAHELLGENEPFMILNPDKWKYFE